MLVLGKPCAGGFVLRVLAHGLKRQHGLHASLDALAVFGANVVNARHLLRGRTGGDQPAHIGHADGPVVALFFFVDARNQVQAGGGGLGLPHGFYRGQFGRLHARNAYAGFVPQDDDRDGAEQAEYRRDTKRALGKFQVFAFEQMPGRHPQHEHGSRAIAGGNGVDELGLRRVAEQNRREVAQLHAHGHGVEERAHGLLHPGVGHKNEKGRHIRAHGHQRGNGQVPDF